MSMTKRRAIYYLLPLAGVIFGIWYIYAATCDVIYSDYVRLVNSYLPDVGNPAKFFVPDLLTRIPVNYLGRMVNAAFFGFNTMFDRVLGVLALGAAGVVLGWYCKERQVNEIWFGLLMVVMFSLNKWEMLTNGSGWAHFLAFACFYYHYLVMDRVWAGREKAHDRRKLIWLPFFITLLIAGPYCAIYSVTVILANVFFYLSDRIRTKKGDRRYLVYAVCALIPLLLYMVSNSLTVEDYDAPLHGSLIGQLLDTPGFFLRFFLKAFSSMVIGGERAAEIFTENTPYLVLGLLVAAAYGLALWMNWRYKLYRGSILPLVLIVSGGLNHVLILVSRWIFLVEDYGASSRYALQYQVGILGIILTFAAAWNHSKVKREFCIRLAAAAICVMFLFGNCYTSYIEIKKAPYRKYDNFVPRAEMALDFENRTDDELRENFEYRKGRYDSGAKVRSALTILKEQGWSVFRGQKGKDRT